MPASKLRTVSSTPAPLSKKRAAFQRVAVPRIQNAVNSLQVLGIAADRQRYDITERDVEYICETIMAAATDCCDRFRAGTRKPSIKLPD
jgi:hypothetical protein